MATTEKGSNEPDNTTGRPTKYPLYIIKSKKSLTALEEKLNEFSKDPERDIGHMHILYLTKYDKHRNQRTIITDKNFVLLSRAVVAAASKDPDFPPIENYILNDGRDALPEGCRCIKVSIPEGMTGEWAENGMKLVMDELVKFKVLNFASYKIEVPIKERDTGMHTGRLFITFNDDVDEEAILISRVFMHQHFWYFHRTRTVYDHEKKKKVDIRNHIIVAEWANPGRGERKEHRGGRREVHERKERGENRGPREEREGNREGREGRGPRGERRGRREHKEAHGDEVGSSTRTDGAPRGDRKFGRGRRNKFAGRPAGRNGKPRDDEHVSEVPPAQVDENPLELLMSLQPQAQAEQVQVVKNPLELLMSVQAEVRD